ncbi:MAG: M81 family metallopeptidase [Candidatus Latescibacterota bacterium]
MNRPRVALAALSHETSTFTPVATTWDSYRERFGYLRGQAVIDTFGGTNTPIGGFVEGARAHGFELLPVVFAHPQPSGPTPRVIFDEILRDLVSGLRASHPLDGVLLELHGSMVAEDADDADGEILEAVRAGVGATVPVLAQLDIHANVSPRMVRFADWAATSIHWTATRERPFVLPGHGCGPAGRPAGGGVVCRGHGLRPRFAALLRPGPGRGGRGSAGAAAGAGA